MRLVLAGGGHAHLAVLEALASSHPPDLETVLITPEPVSLYSGMVPGWMAGLYSIGDLTIDVAALARRAGIAVRFDTVCRLHADRMQLTLASGDRIDFDLLSLATGGEADCSRLAMLSDGLLTAKPTAQFVASWPGVLHRAEAAISAGSNFHLAIVGGGAAGVELALCAAQALRSPGGLARVSLVVSERGLLAGHAPSVISRAMTELRRKAIAVINRDALGDDGGLLLSDGSRLAVDQVIAATGTKAPGWLTSSGLSLDCSGHIAIGPDLRSISHPAIFAAGDIVSRVDRTMARSGVHAVRAGPVLARNLLAMARHEKSESELLEHYIPHNRTLYLLATGDRRAVLSWGGWCIVGHAAWRLKDWIDRRFIAHYAALAKPRSKVMPATSLWSSARRRPVLTNALKVAAVVGTCLNLINQGSGVWHGAAFDWPRGLMNFTVPFLVATYSGAKASQMRAAS